tara:strand:+ start:1341 stop:2030 length:690 start_codon:yes stop_codon:yes gene_type:complete
MTNIKIKFFAKIKDDIGMSELNVSFEGMKTVKETLELIAEEHNIEILNRKNYMYAKNMEYCTLDTKVSDGDEIAIIPPVSGGKGNSITVKDNIIITKKKILAGEFVPQNIDSINGSIVTFYGVTREFNQNKKVEKLFYESYEEMAKNEIEQIILAIKDKWSIDNVIVIHRTGYVYPGEISMILIIRSKHRKEAFESSKFFVDELKKTVPIWKKEFFSDGTVWINDNKVE